MKSYLFSVVLSFSIICSQVVGADKAEGWNQKKMVFLYFHNSETQTQWAFEAFSKYRVRGNERILDFGSGDGKLSAILSFLVPKGSVTGVDISKEMVNFSAKMFPYGNLSFIQTQDVNFADFITIEKYDLVTSFSVLHLVPNPTVVLENIRNVMKPSGKLIATIPLGGNEEFYLALNEEMQKRGWSFPETAVQSLRMRTEEGIRHILDASGFKIESFEVMRPKNPFASKREFIDWCKGTLSANCHIPPNESGKFFKAVVERYLKYKPDAQDKDGFVYLPCDRVDIVATIKKP